MAVFGNIELDVEGRIFCQNTLDDRPFSLISKHSSNRLLFKWAYPGKGN
jgi:hypothetical protein